MQQLRFLLPLALCLFIFSSCQKCKDCSCSQIVSQTGMPDVNQNIEINDVCDEDLEDIEGTITFTQTEGGVEQSVEQSCDCK
jgi:hypothetical protein